MGKIKNLNTLDTYVNVENPSKAEATNFVNGDFTPDHEGHLEMGDAKTVNEDTETMWDSNAPLMDVCEFDN